MPKEAQTECPFCGQLVTKSNLAQHKRYCKENPNKEVRPQRMNTKQPVKDILKHQLHNLEVREKKMQEELSLLLEEKDRLAQALEKLEI